MKGHSKKPSPGETRAIRLWLQSLSEAKLEKYRVKAESLGITLECYACRQWKVFKKNSIGGF